MHEALQSSAILSIRPDDPKKLKKAQTNIFTLWWTSTTIIRLILLLWRMACVELLLYNILYHNTSTLDVKVGWLPGFERCVFILLRISFLHFFELHFGVHDFSLTFTFILFGFWGWVGIDGFALVPDGRNIALLGRSFVSDNLNSSIRKIYSVLPWN